MGQELIQHRTAARPETASSPGAIACELREPPFIQLSGIQAMSIKPAVQISEKPQVLPGVDTAIALFEKQPSKPVNVTRQWTISKTLNCAWVPKKPCRHTTYTSKTSQLDVGDYPDDIAAL